MSPFPATTNPTMEHFQGDNQVPLSFEMQQVMPAMTIHHKGDGQLPFEFDMMEPSDG
jgi:hypothetical protein